MAELVLIRHGETEWSRDLRHTGLTDIALTDAGERAALAVAPALAGRRIALVLSSPLTRARRTAELAGMPGVETTPDLREWDYGGYEGRTTTQIRQDRPGWYLWRDGVVPGDADHPGERVEDVGARADRVLARVGPVLREDRGDIVLVGHGHALRVLAARWLDLSPVAGALFALDTATLSSLGFEHARQVFRSWNVPAVAADSAATG